MDTLEAGLKPNAPMPTRGIHSIRARPPTQTIAALDDQRQACDEECYVQ